MSSFSTEVAGPSTVIRVDGRLDLVSAPELRSLVVMSVNQGRPTVVVDMSAVDFLDSSGLGALVTSLKTTRQAGGTLRVAELNDQALVVLDLTMMGTVLHPYATVAEALEAK